MVSKSTDEVFTEAERLLLSEAVARENLLLIVALMVRAKKRRGGDAPRKRAPLITIFHPSPPLRSDAPELAVIGDWLAEIRDIDRAQSLTKFRAAVWIAAAYSGKYENRRKLSAAIRGDLRARNRAKAPAAAWKAVKPYLEQSHGHTGESFARLITRWVSKAERLPPGKMLYLKVN
jgi:hypothetical protein